MLVLAGLYATALLLFAGWVVYLCRRQDPPTRLLVALILAECLLILLHTLVFAVSILLI